MKSIGALFQSIQGIEKLGILHDVSPKIKVKTIVVVVLFCIVLFFSLSNEGR